MSREGVARSGGWCGLRITAGLLLALSLSGCLGYRVGDVSGRNLQGVRSVYVPVAKNVSLQPDLQVLATDAIIQRLNSDGTLEVNQTGNADSELDVTIFSVMRNPVASSSNSILVTFQYQLVITAKATYVNRRLGRKIFENADITGTTTYFTTADLQESERQALPLAAADLANNVVKQVTEGW
jgi:hypothetical protein